MTFGEQNTEKEAHDMLNYSFEQGINTIDTAEAVSSLHSLQCDNCLFFLFLDSFSVCSCTKHVIRNACFYFE